MNEVRGSSWIAIIAGAACLSTSACDGGGCSRYASKYSCYYVEKDAEYEVWYWRNLDRDNEDDNKVIGRAIGLQMCEVNARAFAAAIGETFNYRAHICVLMKDGIRMEKHRLLAP